MPRREAPLRACSHCGFEATEGSSACPLCGSLLEPGPGRASRAAPPPWEDPDLAFPANLIATWRESLFEPTRFFGRIGEAAAFSRPLLYFLLVTVVGAFFTLIWETLGVWPGGWGELSGRGPLPSGAPSLIGFFASPFVALLGLGVWSLMLHLFVLIFVPERRPLGMTARVICYATGPTVFSVVPLLGSVVGGVWIIVLQIVGLREVHRTTTGRAAAAVLVPLGSLFVLLFLLLLFVFVAGMTLLESYT